MNKLGNILWYFGPGIWENVPSGKGTDSTDNFFFLIIPLNEICIAPKD